MRFRQFSKMQGSLAHAGGTQQRRFGSMVWGTRGSEAHGSTE
jgi:hypothetical protein